MYLYLKQNVFSLREKFTFYDEQQKPVFTAKGSFFALPKKFTLFENDKPIVEIRRAYFAFFPKFSIFDLSTNSLECTLKQNFSFMKNFTLSTPKENLRIYGSLLGYEFDIKNSEGNSVLSVHKNYISWGDIYQIYFDETQIEPKIVAAILVAIDNAVHPNET